jgi:transposase-like protein|tara:strand:+ start:1413 stop:1562 length:150 start_codon:yes stop_codon:yes gene_type:complete
LIIFKETLLRWKFKLRVLDFAIDYGKVKETCEMFNVSRSTFFSWKRKYD